MNEKVEYLGALVGRINRLLYVQDVHKKDIQSLQRIIGGEGVTKKTDCVFDRTGYTSVLTISIHSEKNKVDFLRRFEARFWSEIKNMIDSLAKEEIPPLQKECGDIDVQIDSIVSRITIEEVSK
jgi:hypothetical protein